MDLPETETPRRFPTLARLARMPHPTLPPRGVLLGLAALLAVYLAGRFFEHSLRLVEPGTVGVCVSRFTGHLVLLPPGTHFRPSALYEIHPVRVSDQLLSGPAATFSVTTKDGIPVTLSIQARWALDRERLLARWAALPRDPARELIAPVVASAFRSTSPAYEIAKISAEKREEFASVSAKLARQRLADSGVVLKEVLIGDLALPPEYEKARAALQDEVQNTERMEVTIKLRGREVERGRLEGEAEKAKREKAAEAAAAERVIGARGEEEAMHYILALKKKEIEQKKLEAEADKETRVRKAEADSAISKIQALADADRRRSMADAEAYSIRTTSAAQFENLKKEAELVSANPLLVPKTFADRLSDKVQVILTPTIGGEAFTGEVFRRVAAGKPATQVSTGTVRSVSHTQVASADDADGQE